MLFILTGDIRTGKTTWLEARVRELEAVGVPVRGVLAPGVWRDGEKVGIENVLLPSRERVLLATPAGDGCSTGLGWDFNPAALARVNAHLAGLNATAVEKDVCPGSSSSTRSARLSCAAATGSPRRSPCWTTGPRPPGRMPS